MLNNKYALLINDMQNDFVLPGEIDIVNGAYETIPTILELLEFARAHRFPVFHLVREYRYDGSDIEITRLQGFLGGKRCAIPGTYGCEIVNELRPIGGEYRLVRNRFSAFMQTELDFMLRRLDVQHVLICGTQYPNCVRSTAFDAVCYGYETTVVTDATSADTDEIAQANILDMKNIGIHCRPLDTVLDSIKHDAAVLKDVSTSRLFATGAV